MRLLTIIFGLVGAFIASALVLLVWIGYFRGFEAWGVLAVASYMIIEILKEGYLWGGPKQQ